MDRFFLRLIVSVLLLFMINSGFANTYDCSEAIPTCKNDVFYSQNGWVIINNTLKHCPPQFNFTQASLWLNSVTCQFNGIGLQKSFSNPQPAEFDSHWQSGECVGSYDQCAWYE
ncbi:MAG: hypothetical protein KIT27_11770 [Legionellales bacterium]|nr:hypothetical protein [Legionellales bacterium]